MTAVATTTELMSCERDLLQSLKYLPSGPSQKNPSLVEEEQALSQKSEKKVILPSNSATLGGEKQRISTKLIPSSLSHTFMLNDKAPSSHRTHKQRLNWGLPRVE